MLKGAAQMNLPCLHLDLKMNETPTYCRDVEKHCYNNTATPPPCGEITQSTVPAQIHQTGLVRATKNHQSSHTSGTIWGFSVFKNT